MSIKDYLKNKFKEVKVLIPSFDPSYEFDKESNTYFVFVSPSTLIDTDIFERVSFEALIEISNKFPNDNLCFINNESLISLKNPKPLFDSIRIEAKSEENLSKYNILIQNPIYSGFPFYRRPY